MKDLRCIPGIAGCQDEDRYGIGVGSGYAGLGVLGPWAGLHRKGPYAPPVGNTTEAIGKTHADPLLATDDGPYAGNSSSLNDRASRIAA